MTTTTQSTIVAVFRNASDAQAAANDLKSNGISSNDVYISSEEESSTARKSTTGQTTDTGITGWFKRVFGNEDEEDRSTYENAVRSGNVLLSVDTTEENFDRVANILNNHSPVDVHRDSSGATPTATKRTTATGGTGNVRRETGKTGANESGTIPVVREELQIGKRSIVRGGVRIYTRTIEQPVEETVRLREERVRVERQNVNRPVNESDLRGDREQVIEVKEYAEEPVVSKQARVVEEVRVSKEAAERNETIRDTVRSTEVEVENLGRGDGRTDQGRTDFDADFRRDFAANYGSSGETYETYSPAYRYGYEMANDPRYRGRDFSEVESNLREDYGRRYPNSTWERMKASVRYGWDKVTGKTRTTTASSR